MFRHAIAAVTLLCALASANAQQPADQVKAMVTGLVEKNSAEICKQFSPLPEDGCSELLGTAAQSARVSIWMLGSGEDSQPGFVQSQDLQPDRFEWPVRELLIRPLAFRFAERRRRDTWLENIFLAMPTLL